MAGTFATAAGNPSITSLAGGGAILCHHGSTGRVEVCDFFANAPGLGGQRVGPESTAELPDLDFYDLSIDFGAGATEQTFHVGRGAAAVPGVIAGLCAVHERWGVLPLAPLLEPTIDRLRSGVSLTEYHANCARTLQCILEQSAFGRRLFLDQNGDLRAPGSLFHNPDLAGTLEELSRKGPKAFHEEILSPAILAEFGEDAGGWITPQDLRDWHPNFRQPLERRYQDATVWTNPPPSFGGPFVSLTLDLIRRAQLEHSRPLSGERFAPLAAIFRALSELRATTPDLSRHADALALLETRLHSILEGDSPTRDTEPKSPGNTTHLNTVDDEGNAISVTISYGEGNGSVVPGTGILMNNLLGEADLFPNGFHRFVPGTRLNTMMAPTILRRSDGEIIALGSGGSNRIRTAIPQVISALIDERSSLQDAANRARIHFEDGVLSAETFLLTDATEQLSSASKLAASIREFEAPSLFFGGVHIVRRDHQGRLAGVGDPRRGGTVSGTGPKFTDSGEASR